MGYVFGKAAAKLGKDKATERTSSDEVTWLITPEQRLGIPTAQLIVRF